MKTSHLSLLLAILLAVAAGISGLLLAVGPERVERQAVELFQTQKSLVAEQGAMRISDTFRDIQTRLDEAAQQIERHGPPTEHPERLRQTLRHLGNESDRAIGIALLMVSPNDKVVAVEPGLDRNRVESLTHVERSLEQRSPDTSTNLCVNCLEHSDSVSMISTLDDGRKLVANIRLDKLLDGIFRQITRGHHARAALLGANGEVLYGERDNEVGSEQTLVGTAQLPRTDWQVVVETPRSAVGPGIRRTVRSILYASLGLLVVLLAALGLLGYLRRREHVEQLERLQALARTDKLATVEMLGSSILHEIRNVISAVELNLELARRTGEPHHLDNASHAVARLEELAENGTGYVGDDQSDTDQFALSEAVQGAVELVAPKIDTTSVELETRADPTARNPPSLRSSSIFC